jgi:transcriptional regulator with XRE-family HTH domain
MPHLLPSYLHKLRKQWGLSQPDIASLLGITGSALSRFENRSRRPNARLIAGAEVLFGHGVKDVFPAFYRDIERAIVNRARRQHDRLESKADPASREKLRFLNEIIERASQTTLNI